MFFNTIHSNKNRQQGSSCSTQFRGNCGEGLFRNKENWGQLLAGKFGNIPSTNIEERSDTFLLCLYAAGLNKDDFKISVQDNILTIVYEAPKEVTSRHFMYQENDLDSFERSFQLNGMVLTDQITAAYVDGVLAVNLPKDLEAQQTEQEIKIH